MDVLASEIILRRTSLSHSSGDLLPPSGALWKDGWAAARCFLTRLPFERFPGLPHVLTPRELARPSSVRHPGAHSSQDGVLSLPCVISPGSPGTASKADVLRTSVTVSALPLRRPLRVLLSFGSERSACVGGGRLSRVLTSEWRLSPPGLHRSAFRGCPGGGAACVRSASCGFSGYARGGARVSA